MPDPIDQTPPSTQPTTPPPVMSDPQAAVDAALSPTPNPPTPVPETTPAPQPTMETLGEIPKPPETITPPSETQPVAQASGEDVPLSLLGSMPEPSSKPDLGTSIPMDAVPPAPIPTPMPSETPKKKSKLGMIVVALFLVVGIGFGGYFAYDYYVQEATIAAVNLSENDCHGCDGGHQLTWRNGQCVWKARLCEDTSTPPPPNTNNEKGCNDAGYAWCVGCGGFCNTTKDKGCYNLQQDKCGEGQPKGANIVSCSGNFVKDCRAECGVCFDRTGKCLNETTPGVQDGLCGIVGQVGTPGSPTSNIGTQYYYCPGMIDKTQAGCQIPGKPANPKCYCGTVQIDTPGQGFTSNTMTCGCDGSSSPPTTTTTSPSPSPSPSPGAPVMMCTGITRTPTTAPEIGDTLTFTCSGSITPTTAGTLSYKFRSSINSATPTAMTNKTPTTAELTVNACGTYKVECQTCATIAGVLKCDPNWIGATQ